MTILRSTTLATARDFKQALLDTMFGTPVSAAAAPTRSTLAFDAVPHGSNIVGIGIGAKETLGEALHGETAVRVYVKAKLPRAALSNKDLVPSAILGLPTDVIPVADLCASVSCGASVGHLAVTSGTAGCLLRRPGDQNLYVLSNNHVLANSSDVAMGTPGGPCSVGDAVLQPGPSDGGVSPANAVATLAAWVPLDFTGAVNAIDAAIATITVPGHFTADITYIGMVAPPPAPAVLYQSVRKWGRTTNHTVGVVMDLAATIRVRYGTRFALFEDQLGIHGVGAGSFSAGGDSGSLIVDAVTKRAVGLLFATGGSVTFANPIGDVLADPVVGGAIV